MSTPLDITDDLGTMFFPKSALVFYDSRERNSQLYVEHFDMDINGNTINAHPLTVKEAEELATALQTEEEKNKAYLKPKGIIPTNILHINPVAKGSVLWYTKAQKRQLFFIDGLGIPNGKANVPPMLWLATRNRLSVFALASDRRPSEKTPLHHAPFFNVYDKGNVCMGTINVDIKNSASVEEFTSAWEYYFFNSYFSHLLGGNNPINGNCVAVWKDLIGTDKQFPIEVLKKNNFTLKKLLQ